ncbi:hypothetical protein [Streptacidiphilus monticola]|uniref:Uncharacterized protein n=1 Tax=Streptacidiphilus monticola TaxID=2161674 RepID=A0ABW1G0J9_9ACTN
MARDVVPVCLEPSAAGDLAQLTEVPERAVAPCGAEGRAVDPRRQN